MRNGDERDYWQAKNITDRVFAANAKARLLVHCGYGHAQEREGGDREPMATHLRRMTGLDPLTVDQTVLSERGEPGAGHRLRRAAAAQGLLGDQPVVLLDVDGMPIGSGASYDLSVFGRRTAYSNGRPRWMTMDGRRQARGVTLPECEADACAVEVRVSSEPDGVPFDRVEVKEGEAHVFIPVGRSRGDVELWIFGLEGTKRAQRSL